MVKLWLVMNLTNRHLLNCLYKELWRRNIKAVDNASQIDAIANDKENACLVLLITDHLNWDNEFEHLKILQDKINAYVAFIESEQYDEIYPNADFKMAMIEIHFKYDITDNCQKFLQVVQDQLGQIGIKIKAQISWQFSVYLKKKWYGKIFILKNIIIGGTKNGVIRTVWKKKRSWIRW